MLIIMIMYLPMLIKNMKQLEFDMLVMINGTGLKLLSLAVT